MSFVYPWMLLVMMVPFVIFAILILTNKDGMNRVFSKKALQRLRVGDSGGNVTAKVRNVVILVAIFMMIIALARPVFNDKELDVDTEGMDVLLALDISASMRSKDNYPSRLGFAKIKIAQMLKAMPTNDAAEALAFAHSSFLLAPLTEDKDVLREMIDSVSEDSINQGSTNFSVLGESVSNILKEREPKILVVFSDGGDKKAMEGFRSILSEKKITMYAVLVGTKKGAPVLDRRGKIVKKRDGSMAITQMNMELGIVAEESGGEYLLAGNGAGDMKKLVDSIREKFGNKKKGKSKVMQRDELFIYPLILAVILILISLSSSPVMRKRK